MSGPDWAVASLNLHARLAAACGALGVPGEALATALQVADDRRVGGVRFATDARLDRLAVVQDVPAEVADDLLDAVRADEATAWLLSVGTERATVAVEVDRDGIVRVAAEVPIDASPGEALERSGAPSAARAAWAAALGDLLLPRAVRLGFGPAGFAVTLAQAVSSPAIDVQAARLAAVAAMVGSQAQSRWLAAMHQALGPGRTSAPVTLRASATGLVEVEVGYGDVLGETALRIMDGLYPLPHNGAALGALAAVGQSDTFALGLVARGEEPPGVRIVAGR